MAVTRRGNPRGLLVLCLLAVEALAQNTPFLTTAGRFTSVITSTSTPLGPTPSNSVPHPSPSGPPTSSDPQASSTPLAPSGGGLSSRSPNAPGTSTGPNGVPGRPGATSKPFNHNGFSASRSGALPRLPKSSGRGPAAASRSPPHTTPASGQTLSPVIPPGSRSWVPSPKGASQKSAPTDSVKAPPGSADSSSTSHKPGKPGGSLHSTSRGPLPAGAQNSGHASSKDSGPKGPGASGAVGGGAVSRGGSSGGKSGSASGSSSPTGGKAAGAPVPISKSTTIYSTFGSSTKAIPTVIVHTVQPTESTATSYEAVGDSTRAVPMVVTKTPTAGAGLGSLSSITSNPAARYSENAKTISQLEDYHKSAEGIDKLWSKAVEDDSEDSWNKVKDSLHALHLSDDDDGGDGDGGGGGGLFGGLGGLLGGAVGGALGSSSKVGDIMKKASKPLQDISSKASNMANQISSAMSKGGSAALDQLKNIPKPNFKADLPTLESTASNAKNENEKEKNNDSDNDSDSDSDSDSSTDSDSPLYHEAQLEFAPPVVFHALGLFQNQVTNQPWSMYSETQLIYFASFGV
ncbi:hypothetical protein NUU61_004058 [Penicillium alfredii]|uniref:Uncharacterized protein n=1 Tax=Penicillium alfredii TaxID=1506179 RepID=A0A9W9KDG4_9EURO|nr:uncharacterized protein NUU61_004058 [Penicillium alfredii]KAJ5101836.1 hypothetical protein NUU61_004058 [Penicillium alfredii]